MNNKTKTFILIIIFALGIILAIAAYNMLSKNISPDNSLNQDNLSQAEQQTEEKTPALDFTVIDLEGNDIMLSEMFGKPIVLNFWASWCPPCRSEMAEFNEVYQQTGENITFMMVNLVDGQRETKEKGLQYIQKEGFSFPVYFDTEQEAAYIYGITSIPVTLFIDKDGNIVAAAQGALNTKSLQNGIELIK
jgi:thiol-disulfide isomerase/thioredoxin